MAFNVRRCAKLGTMDKPEQRPEGRLIAAALRRSKLSARRASQLAGMSDGRWGQIVRGYQTMGDDVFAAVRAPADTLARMAKVVGVTPEQLEAAGREDAAEELRELVADALAQPPADESAGVLASRIRDDPELAQAIAQLIANHLNAPEPPRPPGRDTDDGDLSEAG